MTNLLPLFPLGTVLFPGTPLGLHVFEERYRQLVHDLSAACEPASFGVVAIRLGSEVGDERPELYDVGCVAVVQSVDAYADGRCDLVTFFARCSARPQPSPHLPRIRMSSRIWRPGSCTSTWPRGSRCWNVARTASGSSQRPGCCGGRAGC